MSSILFLFIFSHLVADFLLQTDKMVEWKQSDSLKKICTGLLWHIGCHLITYLLAACLFFSIQQQEFLYFEAGVWKAITLIVLIHLFIDILKEFLSRKLVKKKWIRNKTLFSAWLFILDQLFHLISIIIALSVVGLLHFTVYEYLQAVTDFLFNQDIVISDAGKFLLISSLVIITTHFFAYLLQILLEPLKPDNRFIDNKTEKETKISPHALETTLSKIETTVFIDEPSAKIGKYIGMIERLIIVILVISNSIIGLTALIAVKALTRFSQFNDKRFAEYYLIGNLLSLLFGIISGFLINRIIG